MRVADHFTCTATLHSMQSSKVHFLSNYSSIYSSLAISRENFLAPTGNHFFSQLAILRMHSSNLKIPLFAYQVSALIHINDFLDRTILMMISCQFLSFC